MSGTPRPGDRQVYATATADAAAANDPAANLLAEHVRTTATDRVLVMNAARLARPLLAGNLLASRTVVFTDRSLSAVDAARRAFVDRDPAAAMALPGQGAYPLDDSTLEAGARFDVVAIRIPREKLPTLQLLRDAFDRLRVGGRCYIAGATNEGIKTASRLLHELFGNSEVLARDRSHRIVSAAKRSDTPTSLDGFTSPFLDHDVFNEMSVTARGRAFTVFTRPGVFSWEHVDEATMILADVMQIHHGECVLDIGCGAGVLGVVAAHLSQTGRICMVDADTEAIRSAQRTARALAPTAHATGPTANVDVILSDVAGAVIDQRFDVVITNPPFHSGKTTDLDLPVRFIRDAWSVLKPGGRLYLVANRTLPYERTIAQTFGNVGTAHDGPRFKVITATRQ